MRVLHITYRAGHGLGGAAEAVVRIHREMSGRGVDSRIVTAESGGGLFRVCTGLLRNFFRLTPIGRRVTLNVMPLPGLDRAVDEFDPDEVWVHWIGLDTCSLRQLERIAKKRRLVLRMHDFQFFCGLGMFPNEKPAGRFAAFLDRWLVGRKMRIVRAAARIEAPSAWAAGEVRRLSGAGADKVQVVTNPIEAAFVREGGRRPRPTGSRVVLFGCHGGRANPYKGWEDLVRAIGTMTDGEKQTVVLWVFGEAAEPCLTAGVRTEFFGAVDSTDALAQIYRSADVLAFPSKMETGPMVVREAMACGLKVVAFNRAACAEAIEDGVTGRVVEPGDYRGFAEALLCA